MNQSDDTGLRDRMAAEYRPDSTDTEAPLLTKFANSLHREVREGFKAGWDAARSNPPPEVQQLALTLKFLRDNEVPYANVRHLCEVTLKIFEKARGGS